MTPLLALLAQLLHIGLMLAAAPTLVGFQLFIEAWLAGRTGELWQPWRELLRLAHKQPVAVEGLSPLSALAPTICLASMLLATALVPSFALGMTLAPLSDLLLLGGLLALPRVTLALAAMDSGTAEGGLAATRMAAMTCLAEPALFLVTLTLGWLGGTTNLDLLAGLQQSLALRPAAASALAAAALVAVALRDDLQASALTEFSAIDLAMLQFAEALRFLLWCDLIGALFLPLGMATADSGLLDWLVGLFAWLLRIAAFTTAVAALRATTARPQLRRLPEWFGIAALLGLIAALLVAASAVAA